MAPNAAPSIFRKVVVKERQRELEELRLGVSYRPEVLLGALAYWFVEELSRGFHERANIYLSLARRVLQVVVDNEYVPGQRDFYITPVFNADAPVFAGSEESLSSFSGSEYDTDTTSGSEREG
jgi:hypothetical protein